MQTSKSKVGWSDEKIIDCIRETRNTAIKRLLEDNELKAYLSQTHKMSDISDVKFEFIKRSLQQLLISPVDLEHYGRVILEVRKSESSDVLKDHEQWFRTDIERAVKNYIY